MDVQVRHRLASRCAVVDSDVEASRVTIGFESRLRKIEQCEQVMTLLLGRLEERRHVSLGHDQAVPVAHWIAIQNPSCAGVLTEEAFWSQRTEGTRRQQGIAQGTKTFKAMATNWEVRSSARSLVHFPAVPIDRLR